MLKSFFPCCFYFKLCFISSLQEVLMSLNFNGSSIYILRKRRQNCRCFNCVLRKQKELKKRERKGTREQKELERSRENLFIKLYELFFKTKFPILSNFADGQHLFEQSLNLVILCLFMSFNAEKTSTS